VHTEPRTILIVDDDQAFRERLARAFEDRGLTAMVAGDLDGAVFAAETQNPDLAVVDLKLIGPSGLEVVQRLREISSETRVLVLTGLADKAAVAAAIQLGAIACLRKPADADQILDVLAGPGGRTAE
jgi:two-component system response regulator RegA